MALLIGSTKSLVAVEEKTGNLVKSYKQCENISNGVAILDPGSANGIYAAQSDRPLIHAYLLQKEAIYKRHVLPEKLGCIAISPDGLYLAAGTLGGSLFVWSLESGSLLLLQSEAHLQAVSCLQWSQDSCCLVSAGHDARVLVWRTLDILTRGEPVHTLTAHTLAVTACVVGSGTFRECRLYTSSLDGTCCVFDMFTGTLLYTLVAGTKIRALAVDPVERAVYLGTERGVHAVPLFVQSQTGKKVVAVGSDDGDIVSTSDIEFVMHRSEQAPVTALALNAEGTLIVAGMDDGQVVSWEVASKQLVRRYRTVAGSVTQVLLVPRTDSEGADIPLLQRDYASELAPLVASGAERREPAFACVDPENELKSIYESTYETGNGSSSPDAELQEELEDLRARNQQLQQMYDALWAKHKTKQ